MAEVIMASSSKSLIKSPLIPKPRQTSCSLPQISLKPIQFPSLSGKSITVSAAALLAAATPLPSLAAGLEKVAVFYFDPYLSVILAWLVYLSLEGEVVYLEEEKMQSIVKELPEVKQLEEQLSELRSAGWAAIEAMWNGRRDIIMVIKELMEFKDVTARLSKQLTETYTDSLTRIRDLKYEMDDKVHAEKIKKMLKLLEEDRDKLWDDW